MAPKAVRSAAHRVTSARGIPLRLAMICALCLAVFFSARSANPTPPAASGSVNPTAWDSVLSAEDRDWIRRHPDLRLGIDPEFHPFEFLDDHGEYQGIASDYVRLLNTRLGLNMRVVKGVPWPDAVAGISQGRIDVLPCVGTSEERSAWVRFSQPYLTFQRVILTRTDMPVIAGPDAIRSMRVGVQAGSSHEAAVREHAHIAPITYPSLEACLRALSAGKIDAAVGNLASAAYWIRKLNLANLKVAAAGEPEVGKLHFAVRKDWPELVRIIDQGIESITPDEQRAIERRWVAVEYKPGIEPRVARRVALRVGAIVVLVLLAVLLWTYRLKQEVTRRRRVERQLVFRERFERLVSETSSRFIASKPEEIDPQIRDTLTEIAAFRGAKAAYLCSLDEQGSPVCTHAGGELALLDASGLPSGTEPRGAAWLNQLQREEVVVYPATNQPGQGSFAGSILEVPITKEHRVTGMIGLWDQSPEPTVWRTEDLGLLRLLGQILTNALRRKATEEAMAENAVELAAARDRAQAADRLKSVFLATMSHELRTPLNSIIGFTGMLLEGYAGTLNPEQAKQLTMVQGSAKHLHALINDVLDLSKIEAGQLQIERTAFAFRESALRVLRVMQPLADRKGLELRLEMGSEVGTMISDQRRVEQVLMNLVSNAIKFTDQGSVVIRSRLSDGAVETSVQDTGIGIKSEDQKLLFRPFQQIDVGLERKHDGTGLGLSICRRLLELLGGSIDVESEPGIGSTFSFRLPRQPGGTA